MVDPVEAAKQRYQEEREKRLRTDGQSQYHELTDDYEAFDLLWTHELGLEGRTPALRHLVDEVVPPPDEAYVAGLEPAVDLYGDLSRLEGTVDPYEGRAERSPAFDGEDVFKKR